MNSKAPWTDALSNNELPIALVEEITVIQQQISPPVPPPFAILYFDSGPFVWTPGTEITVTHNIGRRPDLAVVWFQSPVYGWNKQADKFKDGVTYFGWSSNDGVGVSTDNAEVIYLFDNNTVEAGNGKIRLFWFSAVDVPSAP